MVVVSDIVSIISVTCSVILAIMYVYKMLVNKDKKNIKRLEKLIEYIGDVVEQKEFSELISRILKMFRSRDLSLIQVKNILDTIEAMLPK